MKKQHLAATGLACVVATLLMVGATSAPQEAYTDPGTSKQMTAVVETVSASVYEEAENVDALMNQAAEEQAAEKAEAEREAARAAAAAANTNFNENKKSTSSKNTSKSSSSSSSASKSSTSKKSSSASSSKKSCTITVDGVSMSYTESYGASSAPSSGAGVWKGSDSTTDGSYGYFIGHNPGSFSSAASASNGSKVTVNDSNGESRTYTVVDTFVVSRDSTWSDISDEVTSHGESVVLQTCVDDGYKIVIAE